MAEPIEMLKSKDKKVDKSKKDRGVIDIFSDAYDTAGTRFDKSVDVLQDKLPDSYSWFKDGPKDGPKEEPKIDPTPEQKVDVDESKQPYTEFKQEQDYSRNTQEDQKNAQVDENPWITRLKGQQAAFNEKTKVQLANYRTDTETLNKSAKALDSTLLAEIGKANNIYRSAGKDIDQREMWESIINGLGHIVAGVVGRQTGLNLGGIEFDKKDWDRKRDQIMSELRESKADANKRMSDSQRRISEKRDSRKQDYRIDSDDLARLERQQGDIMALEMKQAEDQLNREASLRKELATRDPVDVAQFTSNLSEAEKALNALSKDDSKENVEAVRMWTKKANDFADTIKTTRPFPDNIVEVVMEDHWYGSSYNAGANEYGDIVKRALRETTLTDQPKQQDTKKDLTSFPRTVYNRTTNEKAVVQNEAEAKGAKEAGYQ